LVDLTRIGEVVEREFVRVINIYSQEKIIGDGDRRFKWCLLHHPL